MPGQETNQPHAQQMALPQPQDAARTSSEQPVRLPLLSNFIPKPLPLSNEYQRPVEQMSAEPVSMRGGGEGGDICCGM